MFERILSLFNRQAAPEPLPEPDAALALGALLIRVAKADQRYLFEEIGQIDRILARRHDLNPVEAAKMRATCEKLEATLPKSEETAHIIADAASQADREAVIKALWDVSLADGHLQEAEIAVITEVADILAVSHEFVAELRRTTLPGRESPAS